MRKGDAWGYIDKTGRVVPAQRFRIGHSFTEGVASVQLRDTEKWGFIDHEGTFVIPPVFDQAMPFCAGLAYVETFHRLEGDAQKSCHAERYEGKRGWIDHSGRYAWRDQVDHVWDGRWCR